VAEKKISDYWIDIKHIIANHEFVNFMGVLNVET